MKTSFKLKIIGYLVMMIYSVILANTDHVSTIHLFLSIALFLVCAIMLIVAILNFNLD